MFRKVLDLNPESEEVKNKVKELSEEKEVEE